MEEVFLAHMSPEWCSFLATGDQVYTPRCQRNSLTAMARSLLRAVNNANGSESRRIRHLDLCRAHHEQEAAVHQKQMTPHSWQLRRD